MESSLQVMADNQEGGDIECTAIGCSETFDSEAGMHRHRGLKHVECPRDDCGEYLATEHSMKVHLRDAHDASEEEIDEVPHLFEAIYDFSDEAFLDAIDDLEHPGTSEIGDHVGCDRRTALVRLERLEEEGLVEHTKIGRLRASMWKRTDDE